MKRPLTATGRRVRSCDQLLRACAARLQRGCFRKNCVWLDMKRTYGLLPIRTPHWGREQFTRISLTPKKGWRPVRCVHLQDSDARTSTLSNMQTPSQWSFPTGAVIARRVRTTKVKSRTIVIPVVVRYFCDVIHLVVFWQSTMTSHSRRLTTIFPTCLDRRVQILRELRPSFRLFLSPVVKCFPSDASSRQRNFWWRRIVSHRDVYVFLSPSTPLYVIRLRSSPLYPWLDCACARLQQKEYTVNKTIRSVAVTRRQTYLI